MTRQEKPYNLEQNRRIVAESIDAIGQEVRRNPLSVSNAGLMIETIKGPAFHEQLRKVSTVAAEPRRSQVLLGAGLTRSGKTLSARLLVDTINTDPRNYPAVYLDASSLVLGQSAKQLGAEIAGMVAKTTETPSLVVLDEFTVLNGVYNPDQMAEAVGQLVGSYKQALVLPVSIFFRNRGQMVKAHENKGPQEIQRELQTRFEARGLNTTSFFFRDAWMPSSVEMALGVYTAGKEDRNTVRSLSLELTALTLGNPYILMDIIRNATSLRSRVQNMGVTAKLNGQQLSDFYQTVLRVNQELYENPTEFAEVVRRNRLTRTDPEALFANAFGAYTRDLLSAKMRRASLIIFSSAAKGQDPDLSIFN